MLYRSACGYHRFGPPRAGGRHLDAVALARLIAREAAGRGAAPGDGGEHLATAVRSSRERVEAHVAARREAGDADDRSPFLAAEQALLLGHPFHPTPKSRDAAPEALMRGLSPELRGSVLLHWFAAHRSILASGSALGRPGHALLAALDGPARSERSGVAIPVHPWQAAQLRRHPGVRSLLGRGLLTDLGPSGGRWHPTSSLRTLWRPEAPFMLKLSLGMRITNSRRNNMRAELRLGVQASRLLMAGLERELGAAHPRFEVVKDPAWVAVDVPGAAEAGFELALRENPIDATSRVACIAGLSAERPDRGRSLLGDLIHRLGAEGAAGGPETAVEWFGRYVDAVAAPLLWLRARYGVVLEAHAQNTLVRLDRRGWPVGAAYRDSQGWYVAASRAAELRRLIPDFGDGVAAIFDDELVDGRLLYYLGVNNLLGLVGAMGAQGLAEERVLLACLRARLLELARRLSPAPPPLRAMLESPALPCKANLLTCLDGRDELLGPVESQSVYVTVRNPLARLRP